MGRDFYFKYMEELELSTQDKEKFTEARRQGVLYSFVPKRLESKDKPELTNFPFNVLFAKYKQENGKTIMGSVVYSPVLVSYERIGSKCSMNYYNIYGGDHYLKIEYDTATGHYSGDKYVNGISVGAAYGTKWNAFFVHFTMLGLGDGERCEFKEVD